MALSNRHNLDQYFALVQSLDIRRIFAAITGLIFVALYFVASIPALGGSGFFQSYITSFRFLANPAVMVEEGYKKFGKEGIFRAPTPINWIVVLSPEQHQRESKGPNGHLLSFDAANANNSSGEYLLGPGVFRYPYHLSVIRGPMIKNTEWLEEMRNEINVTCEELIPLSSQWKAITVLPTVRTLAARALHRIMFADPDLYRNRSFIQVMTDISVEHINSIYKFMFLPNFIKPVAVPLITSLPRMRKKAYAFLGPKIEERLKGNLTDKQDDLISHFIEAVEDQHRNAPSLFIRILQLNTAVIHGISETAFIILMELAARQEYIQPMREEIEEIVLQHGWSKTALSLMGKLESFMMETIRVNSPHPLNSPRKALTDYVLPNGICIPKGSMVSVVESARHNDEAVYPNAKQFDGLRFYNNNRLAVKSGTQPRTFTSITPDFIVFGLGPQAW
ncbi:hypothetical protein Clacol_003538 [Clathrus columnatus]|uniref:Cytochrome P450 n=1 Tax=Clathrus columnatus TaxID=1419009 RepID=A0AAV5A3T7_9AGAM|nr:hypothetical protein Clacol_003538 [Clathrus columnatus]